MPYLTNSHLAELTSPALEGTKVTVQRGESQTVYSLVQSWNHGMKGVVWKGKDDLGHDVALKFIPSDDYVARSLLDEMSEATKLGTECFAAIKFFGDASFPKDSVTVPYKCIVTEWLRGVSLETYVRESSLTVREFELLAKHLFRALATLARFSLCHEDLHPGNVMLEEAFDPLTGEKLLIVKIIDTGTIKRIRTRDTLLKRLREELATMQASGAEPELLRQHEEFLNWKTPDDHLRVVDCLLHAANALIRHYHRFDYWERRFIDQLTEYFTRLADADHNRRLDDPKHALDELHALIRSSRHRDDGNDDSMGSPFDYISAEMIQTDSEFANLFSLECPWLPECIALQPLYIYGPRGCGKSSVLRWLSFKVQAVDKLYAFEKASEVGVYISCSVELRSRFWLFADKSIDALQAPIIRYFVFLLLEELFDTMALMHKFQRQARFDFDLDHAALDRFADWFINRLALPIPAVYLRLQGQDQFTFLRGLTRKLRWDTWASIQRSQGDATLADPSLLADVCRELMQTVGYLKTRHVTFLLDDYSNQRIPKHLQQKLNQTISFAKQGTPIFKVSSEYNGVDLSGIQEGREVAEINVGERYASLPDGDDGVKFLVDILNKRLKKCGYQPIDLLLGHWDSNTGIHKAIHGQDTGGTPFHYHGIEAIHLLCSGDLALALDLVRKIFDAHRIDEYSSDQVPPSIQHRTIKNFSNDELRRIKYIAPFGSDLYAIAINLGGIARAVATSKFTAKRDRPAEPMCKTHIDIRTIALSALDNSPKVSTIYGLLTSRAILITLQSSRSRIDGLLDRLQLRRIYLPAFQAPLKRDSPIKIDTPDDLLSLLTDPSAFAERELRKSDIEPEQLSLALREIEATDGSVS